MPIPGAAFMWGLHQGITDTQRPRRTWRLMRIPMLRQRLMSMLTSDPRRLSEHIGYPAAGITGLAADTLSEATGRIAGNLSNKPV